MGLQEIHIFTPDDIWGRTDHVSFYKDEGDSDQLVLQYKDAYGNLVL